MGEGQSLTGFPGGEDRVFIDFVLRFCENFDDGVTPRWVRAGGIGLDDCFGFAGELVEFVVVDTLGEENWVEGESLEGVEREGLAPGLVEEGAEEDVVVGVLVSVVRRAKAKTFGN